MENERQKVIVIGLDGATFKNLGPWIEQGLLPNLKFLMDNGVSGDLESTIPRHSAPAWTSFMTGVNPGKHGLFKFIQPFKNKNYEKELLTSKDIKAKTIFEILSENKKLSGVINLPMTYPPFKINGFMISCGFTTPSTAFNFTYPADLLENNGIKKEEYVLSVDWMNYSENNKSQFFSDLIKCAENRKEISFKLMGHSNWDLFVHVFGETDRLQHFCWHYIDPNHSRYNQPESQKFLPLIIQFYQKLDAIVGEFVSRVDKNTSLFVISDHGFGAQEKIIAFHNLLQEKGFLNYKKPSQIRDISVIQNKVRGILHRKSPVYRKIKEILLPIYKKITKKVFKEKTSVKKIMQRLGAISDTYWRTIDWSRTYAYIPTNDNTLYLNIAGREPEGIVDYNGDYLKIRDSIIDIITNLNEPLSVKKLKVNVYKKEDSYCGPYVQQAPDLFFEIEDGRYLLGSEANSQQIYNQSRLHTGAHTKNGIIICYGDKFKRGSDIKNAQIIDLAPTILYILNTKISDYIDGKVLKGIFKDDVIKNNPIEHEKGFQARNIVPQREEICSKQETEKVKERLANLGYL